MGANDGAASRERATVVALAAMGTALAAASLDAGDAVSLVLSHTGDLLDCDVTLWTVTDDRTTLTATLAAVRRPDSSSRPAAVVVAVTHPSVKVGTGALGRAAVHGVPERYLDGGVQVTLVPVVSADQIDGVLELRSPDGDGPLDTADLAVAVAVADRLASSLTTTRLLTQLRYRADHDGLTGLPNRAAVVRYLDDALADDTDSGVSVVFVDVDRFKDVNDALGHSVGDDVLRYVATRIRSLVRYEDFVARFGGDEFVVVARGFSDEEELDQLLDRITSLPDKPVRIGAERVYVSLSAGLARHAPGDDADSMLRHADVAMYRAKASDSRRWEEFSDVMQRTSLDRLRGEADLHEAIARDELVLEYQPIRELATGRSPMREALVRWDHPTLGRLAPNSFIPAAELSGLVVPLGAWVLQRALDTASTWPEGVAVTVNVSGRQLADRRLPALVLSTLAATGVDPARLVLEITETAVMADPDGAVARLELLHDAGVRVAIDDFGTGYTSLEHVQRLPVDLLKIDRSFVAASATPQGFDMLGALMQIGRALEVATVAEGVETDAELAAVTALGAGHAQGWLIGRPAPDAAFAPDPAVAPRDHLGHAPTCPTAVAGRRRHERT